MTNRVALCLVLIALTGCAAQPISNTVQWRTHNADMLALQEWQLIGKMGYRTDHDNGSAWINWQQHNADFDVHLSGPFGAGTTRIHGGKRAAVLSQAGKDDLTSNSAAALSQTLFGWTLPVQHLAYWVKGIPTTHLPVTRARLDQHQLLEQLEQGHWHLTFSRYQHTNLGLLPGKIVANYRSPTEQPLHIVLVIKAWHRPAEGR